MDVDSLLRKYPNVSREELDKIRANSHYPAFNETRFEYDLSKLHRRREDEKLNGRRSILVGPLVQAVSAQFLPNDSVDQNLSFTIYGRIYAEFYDTTSREMIAHSFYNRNRDDAEIIELNGFLTLITPDCCSWPFDVPMPLENTRLVVDVFVGDKNLSGQFGCDDDVTDLEQVRVVHIPCDFGSLALCYNVIPFAVYGRVEVHFRHKQDADNSSLKVKGKIIARQSNSFGGYMLFDKKLNEFEQVEIGVAPMNLSRCWVSLSALSSLIIDIELSEYGTERKILRESLELQVQGSMISEDVFIVDDVLIHVSVAWFSPRTKEESGMVLDDESSDDEMSSQETSKEKSDDKQMSEAFVPGVPSNCRWQLRAHQDTPLESCALQIFSIFIGQEKQEALQIYGFIEVSSPPYTYYVFNKDCSGASGLVERNKTMPLLRGSGAYSDSETLEIKFDLKDVNSLLHIRGQVSWHWSSFDFCSAWINKRLCSVVQGEHGFAAIHYSLFSEAVQASVEVSYKPKNEQVLFSPKAFGSIVAHYNKYDYTSRYNRDYYRVSLFERNLEDAAQLGIGGMLPLSRPVVVVPLGSSLIVEANLCDNICNQDLSCTMEFRMGSSNSLVMEGENCFVNVRVKWEEVSN